MNQTGKSILVIDDNEDMLVMVSLVLRKNGYRVSSKSQFTDLHTELKAILPDLILVDRKLGWIDGYDLCKHIRSFPEFSATKILIFSAYKISPEECAEVGANGYFEKPFEMQSFLTGLKEHLGA